MVLVHNIEHKEMSDSIALANYFIDKSVEDHVDITLLKLVKLVYIAHGYLLALLNKSFLRPRYDRVEAWQFGPVIPTVYHTFKYNANNPITAKGIVCIYKNDTSSFVEPTIPDEPKIILDFVWKRYSKMSSSELVYLLHKKGTPWHYLYKKNESVSIPDLDTKVYYSALLRGLANYGR